MKPELINLVKQLRTSMQLQEEYIDKLPREFQELLFDNEYTSQLDFQRDELIKAVFGDKYYEEVCWFLYEFEAGKSQGPHVRLPCGTHYIFLTDDDYYTYLETQ